jgi:putative transposase
MRHRLYYQIVWTTRDRRPLINAESATFLTRIARGITRQERGQLLEIGVVSTHVHLLVSLHPMTQISHLLQRLKGTGAHLINQQRSPATPRLEWAAGYAIESVSEGDLGRVRDYVRRQAERHPEEAIAGWPPACRASGNGLKPPLSSDG